MFENLINVFTLIGQLFTLLILFCMFCLVIFGMFVLWDFRQKHRKNRYGKHQSAGTITEAKPETMAAFISMLDETEARIKRSDDLDKLRQAANRGAYPARENHVGWEHQDIGDELRARQKRAERIAYEEPTHIFESHPNRHTIVPGPAEILPFNTTGKGVVDVVDSRFENR